MTLGVVIPQYRVVSNDITEKAITITPQPKVASNNASKEGLVDFSVKNSLDGFAKSLINDLNIST